MENNRHSKALVFRKSVVTRALAVAFGTVALAGGVTTTAFAQSNATGTLYGKVDAPAGSSVVVTNTDTGAKRTLPIDSTGRFNGQSLTTGPYKVELVVGGKVTKSETIEVRLGQGTEVIFAAGTTLTTVQVVGQRSKIDVASVGSTTVFTASDLARVPVANNVGAVIQLAPNTTRGDSRYGGGNAPSFGGSSASENAYYINGFPVTNMLQQVGFSQLPFNSIAQAQVLTGGYGAEFGRSTGGVVNIVTKSGGNSWVAGGTVSFEPAGLRSKEKDIYYADNGTAIAGKIQFYNALNTQSRTQETVYVGGPIIQDKLFVYASLENTRLNRDATRISNTTLAGSINAAAFQERDVETPRGLLKLDWNLTDAHHLEYTHIYDENRDHRRYYGFNYQTLARDNVRNGGIDIINWGSTNADAITQPKGAKVDIIKYTGYFTDDLTFTALAGRTRSEHYVTPNGYNPALAQTSSSAENQIPGFVYNNPQGAAGSLLVPGAFDENKGVRFDLEYKLGAHDIRVGIDKNTINSKAGAATAGGYQWVYGKTDPSIPSQKGEVASKTVTGNPYAQQGYIVQKVISSTGSTPTVEQTAWYIEDKYKVTDNVLLSLGLRNEGFNNKNGDGLSYIDLPTQLAPRLGISWDLNGDASTKVFANLGRYHVPLPTNVAIRGAGSSLNTTQTFVYTGVDANGAPTGLTALGNPYSANNEYGQAKDPRSVAAEGMSGNFQDEFAIGFEKALSKDWNVGGKLTYRSLKSVIDDHCDDRPFIAWAARNKVDASNFGYNCALFNPGQGNTFNIDIDGDGKLEHIVLSAADLGFPPPDRKYVAVDLFAEHPFDGKWWGKATYTWSRNSGNTEGQLLSDIGQGDVATTQAWDFPEFSVNANGLLPNNRTHQLKLFGYAQVTPEWGVGGNLLAATGRPKNCIGNALPATGSAAPYVPGQPVTNYAGYGSAYFFCDGVASPRGSAGTLPPDVRVDMNFQFKPESFKGFTFKVDIFNVFNQQVTEAIEERKYNTNLTTVRNTYLTTQSYTAPRSVKFTASYDYKF
jgi:hypothetical protein